MNHSDQVPVQQVGAPADQRSNMGIQQPHQIPVQQYIEPIQPVQQHQIDKVNVEEFQHKINKMFYIDFIREWQ